MALSHDTLNYIRRLFPPKDVNAMLKSILVTTAKGKPQTASSRLPLAVNPMLKVSNQREYTANPANSWDEHLENLVSMQRLYWIRNTFSFRSK